MPPQTGANLTAVMPEGKEKCAEAEEGSVFQDRIDKRLVNSRSFIGPRHEVVVGMFTVKQVYYNPLGLGSVDRRKEIAVTSKNSGVGDLMFCG